MDTLADYKAVLAAVSRATGIPEAHIFTKRRGQIYYDARWMAVQLMADLGYYAGQISNVTGTTSRNVNLIITALKGRDNSTWKQFGRGLEACRKALGIPQAQEAQ